MLVPTTTCAHTAPPPKQVEFPDGKHTLCIIPAKFHKKLWIRNGSYLMVEADRDIEAAVSGQVTRILFDEHVKQLQRMSGIWCVRWGVAVCAAKARPWAGGNCHYKMSMHAWCGPVAFRVVHSAHAMIIIPKCRPEAFQKTEKEDKDAEEEQRRVDAEGSAGESSDSDDGLPPLERIDNRRVLEQYEDDSDSDD